VIFESKLEDNSNEINDFTNNSSNDEECRNILKISTPDTKNTESNRAFDVITCSNNFKDIYRY